MNLPDALEVVRREVLKPAQDRLVVVLEDGHADAERMVAIGRVDGVLDALAVLEAIANRDG